MKQLYIEYGGKRKAKYKKCKFCNKKFLSPIGSKEHEFCSSNCGNKNKTTKIEIKCNWCNKKFKLKKSEAKRSKSGKLHCSRKCKEEAQKIINGNKELWPPHFNTGKYRYKLLVEYNKGCKCGIKKRYLLMVHHIDGNNKNHNKNNLEVVCYNCHIKRHIQFKDGQPSFYSMALTNRKLLKNL